MQGTSSKLPEKESTTHQDPIRLEVANKDDKKKGMNVDSGPNSHQATQNPHIVINEEEGNRVHTHSNTKSITSIEIVSQAESVHTCFSDETNLHYDYVPVANKFQKNTRKEIETQNKAKQETKFSIAKSVVLCITITILAFTIFSLVIVLSAKENGL